MEVKHEEIKSHGEFFVDEDGKRLARLQYFHSRDGEITIFHTEVDDTLAGKGVGSKLVAAAVGFARNNGLKIHATCTYAHKVISETPEFKGLLV